MKITYVEFRESIESPADGQSRYYVPCNDKTEAVAKLHDQCVAIVGPRGSILVPLANVRWMRFVEDVTANPELDWNSAAASMAAREYAQNPMQEAKRK